MPEKRVVMTGLTFGEQPRWHENRLWFSDWGRREVIAVDLEGSSEVILEAPSFPCCVDWLPNGRLLEADSLVELRLRPERLTEEIASFLDEIWRPRRASRRSQSAG